MATRTESEGVVDKEWSATFAASSTLELALQVGRPTAGEVTYWHWGKACILPHWIGRPSTSPKGATVAAILTKSTRSV